MTRGVSREVAAFVLVLGSLIAVGIAARGMLAPIGSTRLAISLSPAALPGYTLRTIARMLAALCASLLFTLTYATWAAKSRRAERVLSPRPWELVRTRSPNFNHERARLTPDQYCGYYGWPFCGRFAMVTPLAHSERHSDRQAPPSATRHERRHCQHPRARSGAVV